MGKHDIAHKEFYSHPENVKDLIQGFVALDCVSEFDFSTLERDNDSFVEKEKNERHDDIIWRLKWRDRWVYVYIIIEFQSSVDETMPVRIMSYLSLLYLNLLANENLGYGQNKKLPIVLPIVLYNGNDIWNVPKNIQDMIDETSEEKLQKFIPKLSYYFIDEVHPEANEKDTVFDGLANSVVATMKLQRTVDREEFKVFVEQLKELFKDENQKQRFSSFIAFMLRLLENKLDKDDYKNVRNLDEVIKMTYTFIDYEKDISAKEGEKKGKLELLSSLIKEGLLTLKQAAEKMNMTIPQFENEIKNLSLD